MEYRYYTPTDYLMLKTWWESWGWDAIPEVALPKTGIIVSNNGEDVTAGFIYKTDSCVCWAENYISSKTASKEARQGAVEFLIDKMMVEAKEQGFIVMMSSVQHKGLVSKLVNAGCDPNIETNMTNLTKVL